MAIDTPVKLLTDFHYEEGTFLWIVNNMFFQYYSIVILIVCAITMVGVSFITKAPDYKAISGLTFGTITAEHREESRRSWGTVDLVASALVLVAIVAAYLYFTG